MKRTASLVNKSEGAEHLINRYEIRLSCSDIYSRGRFPRPFCTVAGACHDTKGNSERIKLICVYFVRYCKYDILQGKMSKSVEISRLHKDLKKMWIGELIGRKFSTFKNMKKC